jgi:KDEL-tailed cysteine endopeptidase
MALRFARQVEKNAFQLLNLSVQELIDCDTVADQGCTGGNPLLAFYFLHRYGLTNWENYPYVGYQDACHSKIIKHPVATVKSWGIISPNHENHMELALRHIGPVAVGFNGADKEFLSYDGGIFYKRHCEQGANHALLVVGYGEEEETLPDGNVTLTKYWIARNSWGMW